jgi:hypothetical protein
MVFLIGGADTLTGGVESCLFILTILLDGAEILGADSDCDGEILGADTGRGVEILGALTLGRLLKEELGLKDELELGRLKEELDLKDELDLKEELDAPKDLAYTG